MNETWALKRRIIYATGVLLVVVLLGIYLFRNVLFPEPTCFDGKQNSFESGIDCGGACDLRCSQDVVPLSVSFSRAVKTSLHTYDLVALVANKNTDNAPREVEYVFTVYDIQGNEMARITGKTIVPLGDFPIIRQNLSFPIEPGVVKVVLSSQVPHYIVTEESLTSPTLRVVDSRYEAGSIPRLYARVANQKRILLRDIPVHAVLYDVDGNVFAVGQSVIPVLDKEATREVVFTWDAAFQIPPAKIRVFPIIDPFAASR